MSYATTDPEEALKAVERAQRLNPLSPTLFQREAQLSTLISDWERAENAYRNAVRLNPEHYAPYAELAGFYKQRGDLSASLSMYKEALALNPLGIEMLRQVPLEESVSARFLSGSTELGRLRLRVANRVPEPERNRVPESERSRESATLPPSVGVLFVWGADPRMLELPFVKDTAASLDVAFIDANELVEEIRPVDQLRNDQTPLEKPRPLVLVANRDFFEQSDVHPGTRTVFSVSS